MYGIFTAAKLAATSSLEPPERDAINYKLFSYHISSNLHQLSIDISYPLYVRELAHSEKMLPIDLNKNLPLSSSNQWGV